MASFEAFDAAGKRLKDWTVCSIGGGMSTKVHAGLEALNQGVKEVLVTSGKVNQPITCALNHQVGTVITSE